jgi:hypothetical protein
MTQTGEPSALQAMVRSVRLPGLFASHFAKFGQAMTDSQQARQELKANAANQNERLRKGKIALQRASTHQEQNQVMIDYELPSHFLRKP